MSLRQADTDEAVLYHAEDPNTVYDVLVLGAGVSGMSAAHHLLDSGLEVLVLEARDRLGGRVWTDRELAGFPVELGAEFIHGERAATWAWVERLHLQTLPWRKTDDSLVRTSDGQLLSMRDARLRDRGFDRTRSWDLPEEAARPMEDLESYLRRIGFSLAQLDHVRRAFANAAGDAMRHLDAASMLDSLESTELDGEGDYRILEGYDAIVEALGVGVEFETGRVIERVAWDANGVHVVTAAGEAFRAKTAIVTLPLGVLQSGTVRFDPELPAFKQRALTGMRTGPAVKLVYGFERGVLPDGVMALYAAGNPPMWWSPSHGHETEGSVWTAFVTGEGATELMRFGPEVALERGLETLRDEIGEDLPEVRSARAVDWRLDPFALGGYSHVLPGHRGAREGLAKANHPLYWAGEASAPEARACTVHGAMLAGLRAADEVRAALASEAHEADPASWL